MKERMKEQQNERDIIYAILRAFFKGGNTQIQTDK